jgi:hypothetical protein
MYALCIMFLANKGVLYAGTDACLLSSPKGTSRMFAFLQLLSCKLKKRTLAVCNIFHTEDEEAKMASLNNKHHWNIHSTPLT